MINCFKYTSADFQCFSCWSSVVLVLNFLSLFYNPSMASPQFSAGPILGSCAFTVLGICCVTFYLETVVNRCRLYQSTFIALMDNMTVCSSFSILNMLLSLPGNNIPVLHSCDLLMNLDMWFNYTTVEERKLTVSLKLCSIFYSVDLQKKIVYLGQFDFTDVYYYFNLLNMHYLYS